MTEDIRNTPWNTGLGTTGCLCMSMCSVSKSCPTLCDPMDHSLPDSSAHRIFQVRILEWEYLNVNCSHWKCRSLVPQTVKNLPARQEIRVQPLDLKDTLEKEMATHTSILAWEIPCTKEPGGLKSIVSHKELDRTEQLTLSNSETKGQIDYLDFYYLLVILLHSLESLKTLLWSCYLPT